MERKERQVNFTGMNSKSLPLTQDRWHQWPIWSKPGCNYHWLRVKLNIQWCEPFGTGVVTAWGQFATAASLNGGHPWVPSSLEPHHWLRVKLNIRFHTAHVREHVKSWIVQWGKRCTQVLRVRPQTRERLLCKTGICPRTWPGQSLGHQYLLAQGTQNLSPQFKRMTAHHVKIPELAAKEVARTEVTISSQEKRFHKAAKPPGKAHGACGAAGAATSPELSTRVLHQVSSQGVQSYLGMTALSRTWELLKSYPNAPKSRLDIFAHVRRNIAPEHMCAQDPNFLFNRGGVLRTH